MADQDDIVVHELLGRSMQFYRMQPGQLLLLQRMAQRAQQQAESAGDDRAKLGKAYTEYMMKVLNAIETLFVSEQDRLDVEEAMLTRRIAFDELMVVAGLGGREPEGEDDDDAPVRPAKKATKAAAKKAATSRGRR